MRNYKLSLVACLLMVFASIGVEAQMGSFGNAYVHGSGEKCVHGNVVFNNNGAGTYPGIIMTNRNSQEPGIVSFGSNSSWENADNDRHIDGYVKVYSDEAFTFPTGNMGHFKPLSISGASGTIVSYVYDNPAKLADINSSVSTRSSEEVSTSTVNIVASDNEYWDVRGDKATNVTLYWDTNSAIELLTNDNLEALSIVGWTGNSWEVISSSVDQFVINAFNSSRSFTGTESDITNGSITTNEAIVPNDYDVITFGFITTDEVDADEAEFGSELFSNETIEFTLFPNPAADISEINIDYNLTQTNSKSTLVILNSIGELIYSEPLTQEKSIMRISHNDNTSGTYHIGIYTENGSKVFKPVVVTRR